MPIGWLPKVFFYLVWYIKNQFNLLDLVFTRSAQTYRKSSQQSKQTGEGALRPTAGTQAFSPRNLAASLTSTLVNFTNVYRSWMNYVFIVKTEGKCGDFERSINFKLPNLVYE